MGLLSKGQDVELIKRILDNNDRKAADELVSRYYKCVYKHIYIKVKDEETGDGYHAGNIYCGIKRVGVL